MFRIVLILSFVTALLRAEGPAADELRLADGLHARGLHDMALLEYQQILERHPAFPERSLVLFRAGESARQLDRPETARGYFRQVLASGDTGSAAQRARLRLADLALRAEDYTGARREAEALLALVPEAGLAASALHTVGSASAQLGEPDRAREAFTRLVRTYPDDVFAPYAALMLARMEPPRNRDAKREWLQAALRNPPSRDVEVEALWGLANLEQEAGNLSDSADLYKRLWLAHPDSARVSGGLLHVAWSLFMVGRYEEALEVAAKTPARRKEALPDTWNYLEAVSLRLTDRTEEAFQSYLRLLRETPDSRFRAHAAFDLAILHARRGEYAEVLARAEDILTLTDRRVDALWLLAESARASGRVEDALRWYQALARMEDESARPADARYQRALLLRQQGPAAGAEALNDFALRHPEDPRAPAALRTAGSLWMEAGRTDTAITLWAQVLESYPGEADAAELEFQTALLEMRSGRSDAAMRRLRAHLARTPPPPRADEAAYWLAMLMDQNAAADAQQALESALRRNLTPEQQSRIRLRLAFLYRNQGREAEALALIAPQLASPEVGRIPDSWLLWALSVAGREGKEEEQGHITGAMTSAERPAPIRELGYYAAARQADALGNPAAASQAWEAGLAFDSGTLDAARAALAFGEALLKAGRPEAAEPRLRQAQQLGSRLEDDAVQVQAMFLQGKAFAAREMWGEASRLYLGLAVLFDHPDWSPRALHEAADALQKAGRPAESARALAELRQRYPAFAAEQP